MATVHRLLLLQLLKRRGNIPNGPETSQEIPPQPLNSSQSPSQPQNGDRIRSMLPNGKTQNKEHRLIRRQPAPSLRPPSRTFQHHPPVLTPRILRQLLLWSTILDTMVIIWGPPFPLTQWEPTLLLITALLATIGGSAQHIRILAHAIVRGRLFVLSSPRLVTILLGLLAVCAISESIIVFGAAAYQLLVIGLLIAVPATVQFIRSFRSRLGEMRLALENPESFSNTIHKVTLSITLFSLCCARLSGLLCTVMLAHLVAPSIAVSLGIACSIFLLSPPARDRRISSPRRQTTHKLPAQRALP